MVVCGLFWVVLRCRVLSGMCCYVRLCVVRRLQFDVDAFLCCGCCKGRVSCVGFVCRCMLLLLLDEVLFVVWCTVFCSLVCGVGNFAVVVCCLLVGVCRVVMCVCCSWFCWLLYCVLTCCV